MCANATFVASKEAVQALLDVTSRVPYLATCIHETLEKAGLVLVTKEQWDCVTVGLPEPQKTLQNSDKS